jgi:hypothetical protein
MSEIGSLVVDLTLKSAEFISDLAKSSNAVAANTNKMTSSLGKLQKSAENISRTFEALVTVRAIKQVVSFLENSITLAAKLTGTLGDKAKEFETSAQSLANSFRLGVAQGFIAAIQGNLGEAGIGMKELAKLGIIVGEVIGSITVLVVNLFSEIPDGINLVIGGFNQLAQDLNALFAKFNEWNEWLNNSAIGRLLGFAGTTTGNIGAIPLLPEFDTAGFKSAIEAMFNMAGVEAILKGAAEETTEALKAQARAGAEFSREAALQNSLYKEIQTPMEAYHEKIAQINSVVNDSVAAHALQRQAQTELIGVYLAGVAQATGALASAFKDNKAIQIANAVVNTAAGIVKALGDPKLPFPLDFAVAASIAAAGAAQIATILSTEPGGGSKAVKSPKGGSGASAAGAASTASTGSAGGRPSPTQAVTINIEGDIFGPEHFRKIVAGINGVQKDGTALLRIA